jgi:hypothetical protein
VLGASGETAPDVDSAGDEGLPQAETRTNSDTARTNVMRIELSLVGSWAN